MTAEDDTRRADAAARTASQLRFVRSQLQSATNGLQSTAVGIYTVVDIIITLALIVGLIVSASSSLVEANNRIVLSNEIQTMLHDANSRLAQSVEATTRARSTSLGDIWPAQARMGIAPLPPYLMERSSPEALMKRKYLLEQSSGLMKTIHADGDTFVDSASGPLNLLWRYGQLQDKLQKAHNLSEDVDPSEIPTSRQILEGLEEFFGEFGMRIYFVGYIFRTLSTEVLVIIAILSCSALGALLAGLRIKKPTSFRDLALGLGAGFIAYLGIKGGKFLFLLQGTDISVAINPYGMALFGAVVGLYVERAYTFLSSILDKATAAIGDSQQGGKLEGQAQPKSDDQAAGKV